MAGSLQGTTAMTQCVDPAFLESLESLNISVTDAEEEARDENQMPSHLLTLLRFLEQVSSTKVKTVRIHFNCVHLAHIISAFSPAKMLTDLASGESETSSVVFNKVSTLVQINTKVLVLPMQFLDDLNLTTSAFLTKHYRVSHNIKSKSSPDHCVHYLIKKRNCESEADKTWAVSLRVADQFLFDFS